MTRELPRGWKQSRIGYVTHVVTKGTTPTTLGRAFVDKGISFVKAESIDSDGRVIPGKLAAIDADTHALLSRSQLQAEDVLFSIAGVIGRTALVPAAILPANTNQAIAIIRVGSGADVDPQFLYYQLRSDEFLRHGLGRVVQTAQANLSLGVLRDAPIVVPPLDVQHKIAGVLRSLDDLIENNRQRIEVLEQMAKAVYREWFVRFRYPGHEDATFVDSPFGLIPEGWKVKPFAEIASFVNGFAFKPSHWGTIGRPIIKIKELKHGVTPDTPRCDEHEIPKKYWVSTGDLLFSWSADLGAYRWSDEPGLLNQHLFNVSPSGSLSIAFLLHALDAAMARFWDRAQGTTMRHIKRSALQEVSTVVPTNEAVERFTTAVDPLDQQVLTLRRQGRYLAALRDLLLPKLVTGQIDVSHLDLDTMESSVA